MKFFVMIAQSLYASAGMFWLMFWALVLGFAISGAVQAFVSKKKMAQLLGKPDLRSLGIAMFFGATSSSCSYAASSMARAIFQKGANIVSALAFMIASTNLVLELSLVLWIMMGWQFVVAEFVGGVVLVLIMATLMRLIGPMKEFERLQKSQNATSGSNDDEEVADPKTREGWILAASGFVMEGKMIWKDILLGVVISGFLMVFVPNSFWQSLFLQDAHPEFLKIAENAFVGPLVSVLSFVCSVGNIPMASVLFHGGISFSGAISFIYADLIILPLILVYRKYYGWKMAAWITGILYLSMALTGIVVDLLFGALGWIPRIEPMKMPMMEMDFFRLNYTFWLNLVFLALAILLVWLSRSAEKVEHHCCH